MQPLLRQALNTTHQFKTLMQVWKVWRRCPQLRLGQFLVNAIEVGGQFRQKADSQLFFYIPDQELVRRIIGFGFKAVKKEGGLNGRAKRDYDDYEAR